MSFLSPHGPQPGLHIWGELCSNVIKLKLAGRYIVIILFSGDDSTVKCTLSLIKASIGIDMTVEMIASLTNVWAVKHMD